MSSLITAISLEGPDGAQVSFMASGSRKVKRVEGLSGVRVRKAKRPRTGRDGSVDRTRYRDDAQIVLTGLVIGADADDVWTQYDTVTRALVGAVDTDRLLQWTAGNDRALQMNVRLDEMQAPAEVGPNMIAYQVTLTGPDPNGYSQALQTATGNALSSSSGGGLEIPFTFPFVFNPSAGGNIAVSNSGTAPTPPLILLSGYLLNPIVRLDENTQLVFNGEIAAGDTLYVDAADRTVLLNGTANRINLLTFESSRWFNLPVGDSVLTLLAEDFDVSSGIEIRYRAAYE